MGDPIVGILGGMGPEATVELYREMIRLTPAGKDQDHFRVLIYSNPKIPDRTAAILAAGEDPLPSLVESARVLERAGAGILAVPCNSAHYYLPELQKQIGIPVLNMIEETCRAVQERRPPVEIAGLLATTGTVRSGIYERLFARQGLKLLAPHDADQQGVHEAIGRVKAGLHDRETAAVFESAGAGLVARGAGIVILGCTEIPLVFDSGRAGYPRLDAARVLAQAAVDWALGKRGSL